VAGLCGVRPAFFFFSFSLVAAAVLLLRRRGRTLWCWWQAEAAGGFFSATTHSLFRCGFAMLHLSSFATHVEKENLYCVHERQGAKKVVYLIVRMHLLTTSCWEIKRL
jgi:hypothetical protein